MALSGMIIFFTGMLVAVVGNVILIIAAFGAGVLWGLGVLLQVPFVNLIFIVTHWYEAKRGFLMSLCGVAIGFVGIGVIIASGGDVPFMPSSGGEALPIRVPEVARTLTDSLLDRVQTNSVDAVVEEEDQYVGRSMRDVRDQLGVPNGEMEHGGQVFWDYDDITVVSEDGGKTVARVQKRDVNDPLPIESVRRRNSGKRQDQDVEVISNGGQRISLAQVLVPGKVTVVDFYADWCGPCRTMDPKLRALAKKNPKVVLRKIDIVQWHTPVAQQHGVMRIPYVGVFGPDGRQVGRYSSSFSDVVQLVNDAQRK